MKRKKLIQQPTIFWNSNISNIKRKTQKIQKIILVQPINIKQTYNKPVVRIIKTNNNMRTEPSNIWGFGYSKSPKIQNSKRMPIKGMGFIPKKYNSHRTKTTKTTLTQGTNIFGLYNSVPKRKTQGTNIFGLYNSVPKRKTQERMTLFTPVKMTPVSFLKKESIFTKNLNPWGDVDMDGSLNYMDCNPREVGQDGFFGDLAAKIGGAVRGVFGGIKEKDTIPVSSETMDKSQQGIEEADIKEKKRQREAEILQMAEEIVEESKQPEQEPIQETPKQSIISKFKGVAKQVSTNLTKGADKMAAVGGVASTLIYPLRSTESKRALRTAEDIKKAQRAGNIAKKLQEKHDVILEVHKRDLKNLNKIERQIEKAKKEKAPTKKLEQQQEELSKREKSSSITLSNIEIDIKRKTRIYKTLGSLQRKESILQKSISEKKKRRLGGIISAITPLGSLPEIRRLTTTGMSTSTSSRTGKRGRPKGTFRAGYTIDGVTLSESDFQNIRSAENKKRKYMDIPKVPLGARQFNTIKQAVEREEVGQAVQQQEISRTVPQQETSRTVSQEYAYKQGNAIPENLYEAPVQEGTVLQRQMREQQDDNILRAPNINKGELQQTSGIFHEDPKYNILNAPNFQKGGLRRVDETEQTPAIQLGERPNPNPYGNEYTEIEPGTGRVILKRRPQEKWVTGEAL